jgi:hypothetical protein
VSRPRVNDIARQSGLSRATVDRVLPGRPGVRPETVVQVERAVAELERQWQQVHLSGASLMLDLVMQGASRLLLQARGVLPGSPLTVASQVQVVTPYNEPSGMLLHRDDDLLGTGQS